jgi:hypothetical protein
MQTLKNYAELAGKIVFTLLAIAFLILSTIRI